MNTDIKLNADGTLPNTTEYGWGTFGSSDGDEWGRPCTSLFATRAEAFANYARFADSMCFHRIDVKPVLRAEFEKQEARNAARK